MALKEKTKSKEKVKEEKKGKGKSGTGTSGTSYAGVSHAVGGTQTGDLMQDSFRGYRGGSYRPSDSIIRSSNTAPATVPAGSAPRSSGGYAALRSSMEDYDPAPVMTYEQATAQAQRSYDKYRAKQKAFDEKYGGLEHPEQYYGYRQRSQELGRLQEECVKMVDHMRSHYREMEVEPLFQMSGTAGDRTPYQQQVSAMMSEMEDYIEASNGLPDPTALNQMQTNIVRLQAAIGDLPGPITAEDLRTELQQGLVPLVESRIGQVGVSAFRAMAADYSQIHATGMQVYDKIDSTDGYIEQLLVSIAQYKQQRDSYLEAGLSQDHTVIANLNAAIHDLENQLVFYSGSQYQQQMDDLVRESGEQAKALYASAEDAKNRAADGLGTIGALLVDTGIEGIKMLTDAAVGAITGIPGAALASNLVRSFGQGAYESASKGKDVYGQIGNGVKSVVIDFITSRINAGNEVYDSAVREAVQKTATRLGQNPSIAQILASYSLHSIGEGLATMLGYVEPVCDAIVNGDLEWSVLKEVIDAGVESYLLSMASNILTHK